MVEYVERGISRPVQVGLGITGAEAALSLITGATGTIFPEHRSWLYPLAKGAGTGALLTGPASIGGYALEMGINKLKGVSHRVLDCISGFGVAELASLTGKVASYTIDKPEVREEVGNGFERAAILAALGLVIPSTIAYMQNRFRPRN